MRMEGMKEEEREQEGRKVEGITLKRDERTERREGKEEWDRREGGEERIMTREGRKDREKEEK